MTNPQATESAVREALEKIIAEIGMSAWHDGTVNERKFFRIRALAEAALSSIEGAVLAERGDGFNRGLAHAVAFLTGAAASIGASPITHDAKLMQDTTLDLRDALQRQLPRPAPDKEEK